MTDALAIQGYEIQDHIGSGGMGTVYRGMDTRTGQAVAIKVLKPEAVAKDPDMLTRFRREGEALRQLKHPNIVSIIDMIESEGQHCIVMELVSGGSLSDRVMVPMPLRDVLEIGLDLSDALTRAHRLNIIHRDIKPANVLLAADGSPRLTDFGVAHMPDHTSITDHDALIGTYAYISPEVWQGQLPDTRSDIWSFGIMLYEMLAGQRPFTGDGSFYAMMTAIVSKPVTELNTFRDDIPPMLADLVYTMLEKDPDRRLDTMRRAGLILDDLLHNKATPIDAHPTAILPRREVERPITPSSKSQIPRQTTPFIGREAEIATILDTLSTSDCRLLTLVGVGGMGKTRLALEVAKRCVDRFPDGTFFVNLVPLQSPADMVSALACALDYRLVQGENQSRVDRQPDQAAEQQLLDYLREKHLLLVMDNFEHLVEGGRDLVANILTLTDNLSILVTSREALNLEWEWQFDVQGMQVPETADISSIDEFSAVKLFVERARRVQRRFDPDADRQCIVHICQMVGGMPLAIELAASWMSVLTCRELAAEIEQGVDFLTSKSRPITERHRSLRAVFESSWALLTPTEQNTLKNCAIFRGSFNREAARVVAGACLPVLSALVDKSLLRLNADGRYDLHQLVRQFANEILSQDDVECNSTCDRHADYYLRFMQRLETSLKGSRAPQTITEIEAEIEDAKNAFLWACSRGYSDLVGPALIVFAMFYQYQGGGQEASSFWQQAVEKWQGPPTLVYATMKAIYGTTMPDRDGREKLMTLYHETLALVDQAGDQLEAATVLMLLSWVASRVDPNQERPLNEQALKRFEALDDTWGIAFCLLHMAFITQREGDFAASRDYFDRRLKVVEAMGNPYEIATTLMNSAWLLNQMNEKEEARRRVERALGYLEPINNLQGVAQCYSHLGVIALHDGNAEEAIRHYRRALNIYSDIGNRGGMVNLHNNMGLALIELESYAESREHLETALVIIRELGGNDNFLIDSLGELALVEGRLDDARRHFIRTLKGWSQDELRVDLTVFAVGQFARYLAATGERKRALELIGFVFNHPAMMHEIKRHCQSLYDQLVGELPPTVVTAALERGKNRQLEDVVAELLAEFDTDDA